MRHLIVIVASCLAFFTLAVCAFREISFGTALVRTAVVAGVALLVGFVVVSLWVWFSLVGVRGGEPPPGRHEARTARRSESK